MASEKNIKRYLAYWFQLGKRVIFSKKGDALLPEPIFEGVHYSRAFEECWQRVLSSQADSYLEGTEQTIQHLFPLVGKSLIAQDVQCLFQCNRQVFLFLFVLVKISQIGQTLSCPNLEFLSIFRYHSIIFING